MQSHKFLGLVSQRLQDQKTHQSPTQIPTSLNIIILAIKHSCLWVGVQDNKKTFLSIFHSHIHKVELLVINPFNHHHPNIKLSDQAQFFTTFDASQFCVYTQKSNLFIDGSKLYRMVEGKNRIGEKREVKWKPKARKRWTATRDISGRTTQPSTAAAQPSTATFDGGEARSVSVVIESMCVTLLVDPIWFKGSNEILREMKPQLTVLV